MPYCLCNFSYGILWYHSFILIRLTSSEKQTTRVWTLFVSNIRKWGFYVSRIINEVFSKNNGCLEKNIELNWERRESQSWRWSIIDKQELDIEREDGEKQREGSKFKGKHKLIWLLLSKGNMHYSSKVLHLKNGQIAWKRDDVWFAVIKGTLPRV